MAETIYKLKQAPKVRPREKLESKGIDRLSNAELLAIILNVGTKRESVVEMASRMIKDYGISALAPVTDFRKLQDSLGVGRVKAMQVVATLELGRRIYLEQRGKRPLLNSPTKVFNKFQHLASNTREQVKALYLNSRQMLIVSELIAIGGIQQVSPNKRDILAPALEYNAAGIILIHNHPSGVCTPSEADLEFTKDLQTACNLVEVRFLDHVILTKSKFFSFRESGLLNGGDT